MTADELAQRLDAKRNGSGWHARCPAHDDKTPSLSIAEGNDGRVLLKCWAGCHVENICNELNIKVSDLFPPMTAGEFINEATKTLNAKPPKKDFSDVPIGEGIERAPVATLTPLSPKQVADVAKWRGYSQELVEWLNKYGLIGIYRTCIAFPVTNGVHYRNKIDASWRYSFGAKPDLFVLGGIEEGAHVHVFESQWDALAFADASGERTNIVATRGSSNVKLLEKLRDHSGTIYLWPQRDEPGQKWWRDAVSVIPRCQIKLVSLGVGHPVGHKDLNEWIKLGATSEHVLNAYRQAQDFHVGGNHEAEAANAQVLEKAAAPSSGVEPNLTAVPVLAETIRSGTLLPPCVGHNPKAGSGEARESNGAQTAYACGSSRGGGQNISASETPVAIDGGNSLNPATGVQAERLRGGCEADANETARAGFTIVPRPESDAWRESVPLAAEPPLSAEAVQADEAERVVATGTVGASERETLESGETTRQVGSPRPAPLAKFASDSETPKQADAPAGRAITSRTLSKTLDATVAFLRRYVVFPLDEQADVIALWVAHSWTFASFRFTPYLNVCSPEKRCGKTRLIDCLELVVPKPRRADGISAAALRRIVHAERPTLLLDEIDTIFGSDEKNEANESVRGALNSGFQAGGKYTCCEGKDHATKDFIVFCPKVIAGIGKNLPDTVRDRSIEIRLIRQTSDEKAATFRELEAIDAAAPLRAALDAWSRASGKSLSRSRPAMPQQLGDRQQDMFEPLVAIADEAGGEWPQRAREALIGISAAHEDESTGVQLLKDCRMIFEATSLDKITTTGLVARLVEIESDNSPWPTWWEGDLKNNRLHAPARKLAKLLSPFDIKPSTIRTGDDDVAKGYYRRDFMDAWKRYLEPVKGMTTMELPL